MKASIFKRGASLLMAFLLCLSAFIGIESGRALAAGTESEVFMIAFPREEDDNYSAEWGHKNLHYMNGWCSGESTQTLVRSIDSSDQTICYCIEPGVSLNIGDRLTDWDENFWNNYPSSYNKTIAPHDIKAIIGRILQYGYTGTISESWLSQNEGGDKLAYATATQILVWETVIGERDADFNHVSTGSYDAVLDTINAAHPLRSKILSYYSSIVSKVQKHAKVPSFCSKSGSKAQTVEFVWNGSQYTVTLTDKNNVLGNYTFASNIAGVKFKVDGNKLIVTSQTAPNETVSITASKNNSARKGVITWSDGVFGPDGSLQDLVAYGQPVADPVKGYVNIKVSYGSVKIVKASEDGKVDGVRFRIEGSGMNQIVTTQNGGRAQIDNLNPGVYTVTELETDIYEPQESRKVTVVAGQTATVTFNNTLKCGNLAVIKASEDDFVKGVKFHLYGTAICGQAVDEYAVTNASGVATFEDVLIGSRYTLEEVNTAIRYVVPTQQTVAVEWNKVTQKTVDNVLKKFRVTVNKRDAETTTPQGDASLSGAVYGVYSGEDLIDTYTTDASGSFTTRYYVCGDDWSLREITPSEGYLIDPTEYHIGAEARNYTVEYNAAPDIGSPEDIIKGKIAIIKHSDDGSTQIETPEVGAEFVVYLKSAGSYDAAKPTECDRLVCDEHGFSETKELPYGVYTVHQVSGWEGRELLPDFDVYIAKDGQTYRYLINNANFESYIKIVKTDAETGKTIPYAGAGFQIYDPEGNLVSMSYTYPQFTTIDTFYTNAEGYLITPEKLPYGEGYSIVEVQAPYGYVLNSDPVYFDITAANATVENAVTVVTVNRPDMPQKGKITITKTGEVFSSVVQSGEIYQPVYEAKGLPGAVYEIIAAEDIYTPDGTLRYAKGTVVDTVTTGEDGVAVSKALYLGKYEIREITAPYGMTLNPDSVSVELTYAGQEIEITETATEFYNERQRVQIDLSKVMEQDETFDIGNNGEVLSVQFGLFAAEDIVAADGTRIPKDGRIETVTCDENGHAVFATDLPVGAKLYVKEIATDSRYILSDTQYPVEFAYAGQDTATVHITVNDGESIENEVLRGAILGHKTDRETGDKIDGALFGLFCGDEVEFTEETAILTSETADGKFSFMGVPYGNWIVVELHPAEGYLPNTVPHHVHVTTEAEIIEIAVVNDKIPEIGTSATVNGEKEVNATEVFTLKDVVTYEHLIPGKEYVLKGVLMDKTTGKPLLLNGEEIRSETTFVPQASSGEVTVSFTFDSKFIKNDTDIVVFETLYKEGLELTVHADIEDEGQTVTVHVPEIGTQAMAEGKKEVEAKGEITIEDVISYKNLTPGKKYTVSGVLMNKATGEPFTVNGKEIRSEVTFTPKAETGKVTVTFTFNAAGITKETEVVVFESLYREDVEIAVHADSSDGGQTITLLPPPPEIPQTGDNSNLGFWIGLGAIALGGLISVGIMAIKRKKDGENDD